MEYLLGGVAGAGRELRVELVQLRNEVADRGGKAGH
jgi:hypothetical protein